MAGEFDMLSQQHTVGYPPDWRHAEAPRLWLYNLHYMDYLWALSAEDAKALVLNYIDNHPPQQDHCGWEPYPISLRLMNWCALLYGRDRQATLADAKAHAKISGCIGQMAHWLSKNLETHILANHLLENYLALTFAGACFSEQVTGLTSASRSRPEGWWSIGIKGLTEELQEQLLPDGGHYERSPMYQSRLLCALLWLINGAKRQTKDLLIPYATQMADFLAAMTHPDEDIALFNDSAFGIYNTPTELFDFAKRLGLAVDPSAAVKTQWLADSGYAVAGSDGHRFLMDAGELAPAYQPGHAHSDLLSFECSFFGKRLIVDGGNYDYVPSEMRAYCRGVKAHNTIEIEGQDQCELWSSFRVGRRAYPREVSVQADAVSGRLSVNASHDGYQHLPGRPAHTRQATWHPHGILWIEDQVSSTKEVDVVSRLRLADGWSLSQVAAGQYDLALEGDVVTIKFYGQTVWEIEDGWYCPHFYERRPCRVLTLRTRGTAVRSRFVIAAGKIDSGSPFERLQIGDVAYGL